ncbi:PAS domain-containing protein [Cecembia calidifontis]|jgi:PAS domain-containing protein|uniref:histidine kinase n=1 Tax=Cecembia calidifontis TaxID=1187080 RepID=A0A4Q7PAH9_9BACT|nr:PAS domain-containing protein [Cecembia calidifontis]RZS97211.1 PAS domain-containing protein [Cecembia calidifontis]
MLRIKELEFLVPDYLKNSELLFVCVLDIEGQVFFAGKQFLKLFEPNGADIFEKNFRETLHKGNKFDLNDFLLQVSERPNHRTQIELIHGNLLIKWEFSVLRNEEGDFSGILAVGHKVSDTFPQLPVVPNLENIDMQSDIFVQLNAAWEITHLNSKAIEFFERRPSELMGKTIWQVYPDQTFYKHALEFKKAKESKTLRVFEEFNASNGRHYKIYVYPKALGIDLIFKDITVVQKLSEDFKMVNLTLQAVLDFSDENIFIISKDLRIFGFNNKAQSLTKFVFGKSLKKGDKFLGFLMSDMDEFFLKHVEDIFKGISFSFDQEILLDKGGQKIWYNHKFFPLKDLEGQVRGFLYSCKDIHEEKIGQEKLIKQNKLMREVLYNQSSTLRSPLSSILGLLELIDKDQLDKENRKYFSYLKPLAQELDQVIRNNSKQISDLD